jgi:hypothetical protein
MTVREADRHGAAHHDSPLFSPNPDDRLRSAAKVRRRDRRALERQAADWPPNSPASINAWLLLVTNKPPIWRDPLVRWDDRPPSLGHPNEGFFYPDPLGFWAEVRRWALELFRVRRPDWGLPEALSLTTLLHLGGVSERLHQAMELSSPQTILFLDEPSWEASGLEVRQVPHHIADPHRRGKVYEGFWGHTADGRVVGKSPQHPTTHHLYRSDDMYGFLRSLPPPPFRAARAARAG